MKYEIFLNKVKTNLEKTDNYFSCEIDEILDVVKNSLSSEDIIDVKTLEILLYKIKTYILTLLKNNK
ncbi:MAG: hypothetical protein ACI4OT_01670 [Bacilli bacterium]